MNPRKKAVFFFCNDPAQDPVAPAVFEFLTRHVAFDELDLRVDGVPVLQHCDERGSQFQLVRTDNVLSHAYTRYLPVLQSLFLDADIAAVVNWHAGANAPDEVLTVHTTGDVPSGCFGPADPVAVRQLLIAYSIYAGSLGLTNFTPTTEGTHWSGVVYGSSPDLLLAYEVPVLDVEIGSTRASWAHPAAIETLARSLLHVLDPGPANSRSLLCAGGVHLEPSYPTAVLQSTPERPLLISHVLPNQWLVTGHYEDDEGDRKLAACVASVKGGIHGIVFHDNLKGPYKARLRTLADHLQVPMFKHQHLRRPAELPLWSNLGVS